MLKCKTYGIF